VAILVLFADHRADEGGKVSREQQKNQKELQAVINKKQAGDDRHLASSTLFVCQYSI
jgi:hypothetical protein